MSEYTFKKKIHHEDINNILYEGLKGMFYWADQYQLKENTECLIPDHELLTNGFSLKIHDSQENKWHTLTLRKFLKGLSMIDHHDYCEYDMYDCERVIQYALFGKLIYG